MNRIELINDYQTDFFIARTPKLPLNALLKLNKDLTNGADLCKQLINIIQIGNLSEAIYLGSPDLFAELQKIIEGEVKNEKIRQKVGLSLYQYFIRMTSRCTPFGLFAGYTVGSIDNEIKIVLKNSGDDLKHLRLDMDLLDNLSTRLLSELPKNELSFVVNSTLYSVGDNFRYIESSIKGDLKYYQIVSVDNNSLLTEIIRFTKKRRTFNQIFKHVIRFGVKETIAISYISQLIKAQILQSNLEANVTGEEYWRDLLGNLKKISSASNYTKLIENSQKIILEIKKDNQKNIEKYKEIKDLFNNYLPGVNETKLFQVDLVKKANSCSIDQNTLTDVKKGCFLLAALQSNTKESQYLQQFKKAFEERFETASVRLVDALDAEFGINYHENVTASSPVPDRALFNFKLKKLNEALMSGDLEVFISDQEASSLKKEVSFPDSFSAMVRLYKVAGQNSCLTELKAIFGPSAANLLGRFCQSSKNLRNKVIEILDQEEALHPGKIFAEIIHIPQSRSGNVISRPHLRKYEIVFMAKSTLTNKYQIDINDLYLKISRGRFVLFSKRLGKEVVPRLSTAHNFGNISNLQIYHFLCDLQSQDGPPHPFWSWDSLNDQEFLPRIRYRNIILNLATWQIKNTRFDFFKEKDQQKWLDGLAEVRTKLNLPEYVYYSEGDNDLLLDLKNIYSLQLLKKEWAKDKSFFFRECLFIDTELLVTDKDGNGFTNELIIPFTKQPLLKGDNISATTKKIIPAISSGRNFPIGSEWVYFSIYTGTATADKILLSYVYPLAEQLLRDKFISKWFFIRYNNPKFHLRVRFQLLQKRKYGKLVEDLEKVLSPLISSLQINDISLNMYKREIERYGERTMKFCESLFYLNSMCVLKLISQFSEGKLDSKKQLMIALYGCNQILNDFMFSREAKLKLCRYNQLSFAKEFNVENRTTLKEQLKNEYRNNKNALENIVVNCNLHESPEVFEIDWNRIKKIFDEQSEQTQELISQVIKLLELDDSLTLYELVTSLIHMFVNRLFQTKNRYNEFLIYDYLNKFYESEMNRKDLKGITREI